MNDFFVLEYDLNKHSWHVETIKNMLVINQEIFLSGRNAAFIPVAIASSLEEINIIKLQMLSLQNDQFIHRSCE